MKFPKFHEAMKLVMKRHARQVDKAGVPYILHLTCVAAYVADGYGVERREDLMVTALLHDIVEDYDYPLQAIQIVFGDDVAEAVDVLSKKEGQPYAEYIDGIANNWLALRVKLKDLRHNMNLERMANVQEDPDKRMHRMLKYSKAYAKLSIILEEQNDKEGTDQPTQ